MKRGPQLLLSTDRRFLRGLERMLLHREGTRLLKMALLTGMGSMTCNQVHPVAPEVIIFQCMFGG